MNVQVIEQFKQKTFKYGKEVACHLSLQTQRLAQTAVPGQSKPTQHPQYIHENNALKDMNINERKVMALLAMQISLEF